MMDNRFDKTVEWVLSWKGMKAGLCCIVVVIAFIAVCKSVRIVQPGFVGVSVRLGAAQDESLDEGLHLVVPFITTVYPIDTRIQKATAEGEAASKDLQTVKATLVINYHLEKGEAVKLYRQIGKTYEEVVIAPGVQETFKSVASGFTAEELITQRQKVSEQIKSQLLTRFEQYGIVVDQVNIANFDFSKEFNAAIEAKVVVEQQVLKQKQELERARVEAEQAKVIATGEADAVIEKAKADAESLQLRLQYAKPEIILLNAVEKWDGKLPETMLIGSDGVVPFLNIGDSK